MHRSDTNDPTAAAPSSLLGASAAWTLVIALAAMSAGLLGCGARTEYLASHIAMQPSSWDSLHIDVSFARRTVLGGDVPVRPDTVTVTLFDEAYAAVYAGPPGLIRIPDRRLGDRERITVEACGVVQARNICVQEMLWTSPKRLQIVEDIEYPDGSDLAEGRFDFDFYVERQQYGGEEWERIDSDAVEGYLLAWVDNPEAREKGAVKIPFSRPRGRFNLSRHANYKNFRYYLDSQLLDHETARVNFAVYAGVGDRPAHLALVSKEVEKKGEAERADEVRFFAEQAVEMVIDRLGSFAGGRRAVAYVEDWEFDSLEKEYRISLEVEWDGPFFDRGHYELEGTLEVEEDGSNATFEIEDGNRRAERRWRDRIDDRVWRMGSLDVPARDQRGAPL